jgi:hypothetical protein
MNLRAEDIISIPVKKEWISNGLDYALNSWSQTFNRLGTNNLYKRLEKIIVGKICEDATIEALTDLKIQFDLQGRTEWYKIDQYDIGINDRSVDVKSNFIDFNSAYIRKKGIGENVEDRLNWFLKCKALVPADQMARKRGAKNKRFLFVFAVGTFIRRESVEKGHDYVHLFWDYKWLKKGDSKNSNPAGQLYINYLGDASGTSITIYGTKAEKELVMERVKLTPSGVHTKNHFYQVFAIKLSGNFPTGSIEIQSTNLNISEIINPEIGFQSSSSQSDAPITNDWSPVFLDKPVAHILGWEDDSEFRLSGQDFPRFSKDIEQYQDTLIDNLGIDVSVLKPFHEIA